MKERLRAVAALFLIPTLRSFFPSRYITPTTLFRQASRAMSSPSTFGPLDKRQFDQTLRLVGLKISAKQCNDFVKKFKDVLYQRPKVKRIYEVSDDTSKRILVLNQPFPSESSDTVVLSSELQAFLEAHGGETIPYTLELGYDNLSVDEVLARVMPKGIEIPSSFEQVGHIAHVNLRDEALPYKNIIGQVILDKNPIIRTVVNKIGNIETEYRTFPMEVLAGEEDFLVTLRESNATFTFNFREVYWNSRLQMEHDRLIAAILKEHSPSINSSSWSSKSVKTKPAPSPKKATNIGEDSSSSSRPKRVTVVDMMAGVGPFAVPLAMNGLSIVANDLNPASHQYLVRNSQQNRCTQRLTAYNMDGRDLVLMLAEQGVLFDEVIMNLPQNATDFLDVFVGFGTRYGNRFSPATQTPRIHVYGFSNSDDPIRDLAARAAASMRCSADLLTSHLVTESEHATSSSPDNSKEQIKRHRTTDDIQADRPVKTGCWGRVVRDVAPKKLMIYLSFYLPLEVALASPLVTSFRNEVVSPKI